MLVHVLDWSMDEIWIARDPQNLGDPAEEKKENESLTKSSAVSRQ